MSNLDAQQNLDYRSAYSSNSGYQTGGEPTAQPGGAQHTGSGGAGATSQVAFNQGQTGIGAGGVTGGDQSGGQGIGQTYLYGAPSHGQQAQVQHTPLPRASGALSYYQQYPGAYYGDQSQAYQQQVSGASPNGQMPSHQPLGTVGLYQNAMGNAQQYPYYMQYGQPQNSLSDYGYGYARYAGYMPNSAASSSGATAAVGPTPLNASGYSNYSLSKQNASQGSQKVNASLPFGGSSVAPGASGAGGGGASANMPYANNVVYGGSSSASVNEPQGVANSSVGQSQPLGIRPKVTTTIWEDENTLCYQVDANNVSVVRRADNNMINGTKLLNVAQMTRGRRDGILKSEKVRHVVKIGSMHLKGVWIPFERALVMAQREGIVDLLYPLFVRDIKRVLQTGIAPYNGSPSSVISGANESHNNVPNQRAAPDISNMVSTGNSNVASHKLVNTPNMVVYPSGTYNAYYPQYQQYYPAQQRASNENTTKSPPANVSDYHHQGYGYQQPLFSSNQYYQPYGLSAYSSYGGQPLHSNYGFMGQQQHPQSLHYGQSQYQLGQPQQSSQQPIAPAQMASHNSPIPQSNIPELSASNLESANAGGAQTFKPKGDEKE